MKKLSLLALAVWLFYGLAAQEPSFTWLLDKVYCDSADCFQETAIEKGFSYLATEKVDSGTYWTFEANSWSRVTSSKKPMESQNVLFYGLQTNGAVSIGLTTKDGEYNQRLQKQIEEKGFKEISLKQVGDNPDYIRIIYDNPDGYSLYDISSEHLSKIVDGNRIIVHMFLITKFRKGR